ncbi:hypothetical protein OAK38_06075 [Verrucomicrobia bacterium]|nr:hypothetical protein [Verrucomicrobiota bacterium]
MIVGNTAMARLKAIAAKDYPSYHARIRATAFVFKDTWPGHPDYWEQKLYEAAGACTAYREPNRNEIENLVDWVDTVEGGVERPKPVPVADEALIAEVAKNGDLDTLKAMSGEIPPSVHAMVDGLFDDDPYLCIANSVFDTAIKRKSDWLSEDIGRHQFLLPNPLKDTSSRSHANVAEQRYMVFECDTMGDDFDRQAAMIIRLNKILPLVCATGSGGKSIHGFFRCKNYSEEQKNIFLDYAHRLGADPATLKPGQLARLPGGWRHDKSTEQEVFFYA